MLPINPVVNSQRMLITGQYQIPSSRCVEDKWFAKYCRDRLGMTYEQTKEVWLPIFRTRHVDFLPEEENIFFYDAWELSMKMRFNADRDIVFYESEVQAIKKANIPTWMKKYTLMLYAFFKAINATKISIGKLSVHQIARGTGAPPLKVNEEGNTSLGLIYLPLKKAKLIGLVSDKTVVKMPEYEKGDIAFSVKSILEVPDFFNCVEPTKVCPICGEEFVVNSKTKRDICLDCWRKKEALRAQAYRRTRKK